MNKCTKSYLRNIAVLWLFACYVSTIPLFAQTDTLAKPKKQTNFARWKHQLIDGITIKEDTAALRRASLYSPTDYFRQFEGKIIRRIIIDQKRFGVSIYDTSNNQTWLQRMADDLHTNTKKEELLSFVFIKKGEAVNPYKLADNGRIIRDLNFIQDAKIDVLNTIYADSVDIVITTKDVFSIAGDAGTLSSTFAEAAVYDNNFLGRAQRIQLGLVYDAARSPNWGTSVAYQKYNLGKSFISLDVRKSTTQRSQLQPGQYDVVQMVRLDRPLYTSNARWAGGLQLMHAEGLNTLGGKDSLFIPYKFADADVWGGVNLQTRFKNYQSKDYRKGSFLALRYRQRSFLLEPKIVPLAVTQLYFNTRQVLAEFSSYNIDFDKTTHIFGFGRTEDIPVGYNNRFTTGFTSFENVNRWYVGMELEKFVLDKKENYYSYLINIGTNISARELQDNSLLVAANIYSKLYRKKRYMVRNFLSGSVAAIVNRRTYNPLAVNSQYGIANFRNDTLRGSARASVKGESNIFTKWEILGFRIGLLAFTELSLFKREPTNGGQWEPLYSVGSGFRVRNESLVFGTIEMRAAWFPRVFTGPQINITFSSNLRVRYSGSFVRAPQTAFVL
jgi:hypothetical protein